MLIELKNITKEYDNGGVVTKVLKGISLSVKEGEFLAIMGPSGSGKSTLMHIIGFLDRATSGTYLFDNEDIKDFNDDELAYIRNERIGFVFQSFNLLARTSVLDNVILPLTYSKKKDHINLATKALEAVGLGNRLSFLSNQISGGQKQRVAIARSLINDPKIIFADEPVGNLDSESAENVMKILKELNEIDKKTIVLVTHNPDHLPYADRVIFMKDGVIIREEVHKEKRPIKKIESTVEEEKPPEESLELKMLMASFKNLLPQQVDILLVPFKAKQLLAHLLSQLNDEQVTMAEAFLKELLFKNIDLPTFSSKLDIPLDDGGAGWNKMRAKSFTQQIQKILEQAQNIKDNTPESITSFAQYLIDRFHLRLAPDQVTQLEDILRYRIESRTGQIGLLKDLDSNISEKGLGLNKITAEKVVREIEIIMLLKYS